MKLEKTTDYSNPGDEAWKPPITVVAEEENFIEFNLKLSTDTKYSIFETSFKVHHARDTRHTAFDTAIEIYKYLKTKLNSPKQDNSSFQGKQSYQQSYSQNSAPRLMTERQYNFLKQRNVFLKKGTTLKEAGDRIKVLLDEINKPQQQQQDDFKFDNQPNF